MNGNLRLDEAGEVFLIRWESLHRAVANLAVFLALAGCSSTLTTGVQTPPETDEGAAATGAPSTSVHLSATDTPVADWGPTSSVHEVPTSDPLATPLPTPKSSAFRLLELALPVSPDGIATVSILTTPGAHCELVYTLPNTTQRSQAPGLGAQTANDLGICSWTWRLHMGNKPPPREIGKVYVIVEGESQVFEIVVR